MVKNIKSYNFYRREFLPGLKYFLFYENFEKTHERDFYLNRTFVNKAINKTIPFIPLKFSLLGVKQSSSIELILDNKTYELNNSKPLEIEYICETNNCGFIKFNAGDNIEKTMIIEVIVGNIKEILDKYKQIDFIDSLGTLEIEGKKGLIIKVPKDFNENLYDFSLMLNYTDYYDLQIIYDRIEFIVSNNDIYYDDYSSISGTKNIPLFNTNPYLSIPEEDRESNNKFIYILIYNTNKYSFVLSIKKPKLFSDININKINRLPQLKGEEEKYYYKINFPKGDYNYFLIQTNNAYYIDYNKFSITNNLNYYTLNEYYYYYNIPIDKNDIMNNNLYLNYYDASSVDNYINIIARKEIFYSEKEKYSYNDHFRLIKDISQTIGNKKLTIKLNSYPYNFLNQPTKYYILIIAREDFDNYYNFKSIYNYNLSNIFSIINGYKSPDKNKNQTMIILEDNGEKNEIEYEVEINDRSSKDSYAILVPVIKNNFYIDISFIDNSYFTFEYSEHGISFGLIIFFVILALVVFMIICIIACMIRRRRRKNNDLSEKIVSNDLQPIESSD